jgi:predicted ester cyclase
MQITRHKMKGFDPRFTDLPDYILKCTAQIWEGRDIAALDWHYGEDLVVRTPAGISRGNAAGKVNTMATLSEFPDRQLLGEDVIWCGDDQSGFLSSHRILSTATHKGGAFGAATGRQVTFRSIADTFSRENRVWDEWLIRDNAAIAVQLGQTAKEAAQAVIDSGDLTRPLTPDSDVVGPYSGTGNDNEWGERHAGILQRVMAADLATITSEYDRACHVALPGGDEAHAIRWSLTGRHDGFGRYGAPTGAEVHVMGVSHAEFGPWGLRRETTLIDDIAIWKQILLQTGEHE